MPRLENEKNSIFEQLTGVFYVVRLSSSNTLVSISKTLFATSRLNTDTENKLVCRLSFSSVCQNILTKEVSLWDVEMLCLCLEIKLG